MPYCNLPNPFFTLSFVSCYYFFSNSAIPSFNFFQLLIKSVCSLTSPQSILHIFREMYLSCRFFSTPIPPLKNHILTKPTYESVFCCFLNQLYIYMFHYFSVIVSFSLISTFFSSLVCNLYPRYVYSCTTSIFLLFHLAIHSYFFSLPFPCFLLYIAPINSLDKCGLKRHPFLTPLPSRKFVRLGLPADISARIVFLHRLRLN